MPLRGATDSSFHPDIVGLVQTVAAQPDGRILVGGNFSSVNGVSRSYLARLNPDGSLDATFPSSNAPAQFVNRVLVVNSKIFVSAGDGLRRYDPSGVLDWHYSMSVGTLAVDTQNRVVIGGQFSRVENQPHRNIARLTAAGALDGTFTTTAGCCAQEGVFALATLGNAVLVGGSFQSVNGNGASHLAKINPDGSLDATFGATADPPVLALVPSRDGTFLRVSEYTVARHLANGAIDPSFTAVTADGTTVERFLTAAVQSDGKWIVGGAPGYAARFNADGTRDTSFAIQTDGAVQSIAVQPNGDILLAGSFSHVNGEARAGLARIPGATTSVSPQLTMARCASGAIVVSWAESSMTFALQTCDLNAEAWLSVQGNPVSAGGRLWITNTAAGAGKFFRLTQQP